MILITGQANTVTVTLTEKTTISPVTYLFAFYNKESLTYEYCLVSELSTNLARYNQFTITLTSNNPDPETGEVDLVEGDYIYRVFQLTNSQVLNIDFEDVDLSEYTEVEEMKCRVINSANNLNTQYSPASNSNTVYEG